jgi:hypothetical protein
MIGLDEFDLDAHIPLNECCVCLSEDVKQIVAIETERFPFSGAHDHRSTFLKRGQEYRWPALRIPGTYAVSGDAQAYVLTAIQGNDERVMALLDALDEHIQTLPRSA